MFHFEPPCNTYAILRLEIKYAGKPPDKSEKTNIAGNTPTKITTQSICPIKETFFMTESPIINYCTVLMAGFAKSKPAIEPAATSRKFSVIICMNEMRRPAPNARYIAIPRPAEFAIRQA
jgi:hypothetical protein